MITVLVDMYLKYGKLIARGIAAAEWPVSYMHTGVTNPAIWIPSTLESGEKGACRRAGSTLFRHDIKQQRAEWFSLVAFGTVIQISQPRFYISHYKMFPYALVIQRLWPSTGTAHHFTPKIKRM